MRIWVAMRYLIDTYYELWTENWVEFYLSEVVLSVFMRILNLCMKNESIWLFVT